MEDKTRPNILADDDPSWSKVPYQVILGKKFTTLRESLEYTVNTWGGYAKTGSPRSNKLNDLPGAYTPPEWGDPVDAVGANKAIYDAPSRIFYQDTRLGANDAINCFYQFNRDDDIVHPATYSQANGYYGEGRVYNDTTQRNQTIAFFTFGIPQFVDVAKALMDAVHEPTARVNAAGYDRKGLFSLGKLFGTVAALSFSIVIVPYRLFKAAANWLTTQRVSKFVEFKSEMAAYYNYVDAMIAQWIVATGIYGNGKSESAQGKDTRGIWNKITNAITPGFIAEDASLPPIFRVVGPSIYDIMQVKSRILGLHAMGSGYTRTPVAEVMNKRTKPGAGESDPYYDEGQADDFAPWSGERLIPNDPGPVNESGGFWEGVKDVASKTCEFIGAAWSNTKATAVGATQYVGFRIEKTTVSQENFGNSTKPSPLGETVNGKIRAARDKAAAMGFTGMGLSENKINTWAGTDESSVFSLDSLVEFIRGATTSLASWVGLGSVTSALTAAAYIDIPDEYSDSTYNKSFSINFQLRSPYGDIVSIYQSIIVPLFMIMAAALPRAAGDHSYQSPFVLRAYCAGRFSVPLGIIESLSIVRGNSDFGWTYQNMPTQIDVSITIKDLSSMMYMALRGSSISDTINLDDSNYCEYINTLAGVGLAERVNCLIQSSRKAQLASHRWRNKWTNPNFYTGYLGNSAVGQAVGLCISDSSIPRA